MIFEKSNLTPQLLCEKLTSVYGIPIVEGKTLLFFDEIQACIPAISPLRFFYEKMPGLHVVAAGSLLEFAFEEIPSFGVGRVRSMLYLLKCQLVLDELTFALKNDFSKYKKRSPTLQLTAACNSVVRQTGNKFTYSDKEQVYSALQIKNTVELLIMAGLVIPVIHTSANGLPLGSGINPKFRKLILLDTGIFQRLLGLQLLAKGRT